MLAAPRAPSQLDAELVSDLKYLYGPGFKPAATDVSRYKFRRSLEKEAIVSSGAIYDNRTASGERFELLLVEPKNDAPYFYADVNADGTLDESERVTLVPVKDKSTEFEAVLKLPIKHEFYKSFPVYLVFRRDWRNPKDASERVLFQSVSAFAYGTVKIKNKLTRVLYPFDPTAADSISTTEGMFGIDCDGLITYEPFSPETSYATNDEIVFRFGDLYLSTRQIDLRANKIVVRERKKEEYRRVELEIGRRKSCHKIMAGGVSNLTRRPHE